MGGEEEEDGVFLMVVDLRTGLEAEDRAMRRALWGGAPEQLVAKVLEKRWMERYCGRVVVLSSNCESERWI